MRVFFVFCYILSLNLVFLSCTSSNEKEKVENNTQISEAEKKQIENWNQLSVTAKKILGSYKGIVRERNWGEVINQMQEPFEKSESQPANGVSFTQYLDQTDLNFVDISYLGSNGKLDEIRLDIFLENASEVADLKQELADYWSKNNGNNQKIGKKYTWEKEKTRIILEDVSTSKDPGLQITFSELP